MSEILRNIRSSGSVGSSSIVFINKHSPAADRRLSLQMQLYVATISAILDVIGKYMQPMMDLSDLEKVELEIDQIITNRKVELKKRIQYVTLEKRVHYAVVSAMCIMFMCISMGIGSKDTFYLFLTFNFIFVCMAFAMFFFFDTFKICINSLEKQITDIDVELSRISYDVINALNPDSPPTDQRSGTYGATPYAPPWDQIPPSVNVDILPPVKV